MKTPIYALLLLSASSLLNAQTILIDFGDVDTQTTGLSDTWNNLSIDPDTGGDRSALSASSFALVDTTNTGTGMTLDITNAFDGRNANGTTSSSAAYPASATRDSFYTATSSAGVSPGDGLGIIEFSGLDLTKTYDFTMFASRADGNRNTEYAFVGENSETVYLNAANNITNTVTASGLSPTAGGLITLTVQRGPGNTNQYSYLGALEISVIPEPGSSALLLGAMATGLVLLRRRC